MFLPGILSGKTVRVMGFNGAVGTSEEHLQDASTTFTDLTAATLVEIASANAADVGVGGSEGTGARTVYIYGIDANFNLIGETIILNGNTPIIPVNSYLAIFGAEVLTAGTGLKNAGIISIAAASAGWTSGAPDGSVLLKMTAGKNIAFSGNYTIPAGHKYKATCIMVGNRTQVADIFVKVRENGGLWKYLMTIPVSSTQPGMCVPLEALDWIFPEKYAIELAVTAGTSGAVAQASLMLERIQ